MLGAEPHPRGYISDPKGVVAIVPVPVEIADDYEGLGTIETCSVAYGRDGAPDYGTVIGRGRAGERFGAQVDSQDTATIAALESSDPEAIGTSGRVFSTPNGRRFTIE